MTPPLPARSLRPSARPAFPAALALALAAPLLAAQPPQGGAQLPAPQGGAPLPAPQGGAPLPAPQGGAQGPTPPAAAPQQQPPAPDAPEARYVRYVRAGAEGAKARNIFDAQALVVAELAPQTILAVHGERAGWLEVEAPGGFAVWVYGEFVVPTSEPGVLQIRGQGVRMRPLPSSGPESLPLRQQLDGGQRVRLIGRKDLSRPLSSDWVNVWSPPGARAWVAAGETEPLPGGADGAALWASAVEEARKALATTAPLADPAQAAEASQGAEGAGDPKKVEQALRKAEALLDEARAATREGRAPDYAAARKAYEDVLALAPSESTRKLVEDRIAICATYLEGLALSSDLEAQLAAIDAALERREREMARAARRGPLEGRFDERGWVERVEVLGEPEPVYVLRWRGKAVAELVCKSGRFDLADFVDFEIGVTGSEVRGAIAGPTELLTRPHAVDVTRIEVVSGRAGGRARP
jgi:hypothetical protein